MQNDLDEEREESLDDADFSGVKKSAVLEPEEDEGAEIIHADNADFELAENPNDEYEEERESSFALYEVDNTGEDDNLSLQF